MQCVYYMCRTCSNIYSVRYFSQLNKDLLIIFLVLFAVDYNHALLENGSKLVCAYGEQVNVLVFIIYQ